MSKSNETTPNVPTLRFKEFSGEWKKIRLGSIIEEKLTLQISISILCIVLLLKTELPQKRIDMKGISLSPKMVIPSK